MAVIRPSDLPAASSVNPASALVVDSGSAVEKATPLQVVDSGVPLATQEQAEAGTSNTTRMSPLRVAQAIATLGLGTINLEDSSALADIAGPVDGQTARVADGSDWTFSTADLTLPVAIDDYLAVFVPPSSDTTGASGAWVRNTGGRILLEWFAPFTDAPTNHERIQAAVDLTQYVEAEVVLPNATIETENPVNMSRDGLRVVGAGANSEIFINADPNSGQNVRTGIWLGMANATVLTLNDHMGIVPPTGALMTWETAEGWTNGDYFLSVADASLYSAGDRLFNRSKAYYIGGGGGPNSPTIPHFGQTNIVQFSDGGTGAIVALALTAAGTGYDAGTTTVEFTGGGGTDAAATAIVSSAGKITGLILTNRGTGYSSAPTVTIVGDGASATATATVATDFLILDYPLMGDVPNITGTVTGAVDNGSTLIRITVTAHGFSDYQVVTLAGVGGVPAADGEWAITVIDANTFDLIGSTFAGAFTVGGTAVSGGSWICNATTDDVTDPISDIKVGPAVGVQLSGFKVRAATGCLAFSRTCLLDCDLDIDIDAPEGFWMNSVCFSRLRGNWKGYRKAIELGLNCTKSQYDITCEYQSVPTLSVDPPFKLGECSNYNTGDIWFVGDFDSTGDGLLEYDNGVGNAFTIHSLSATSHTSNILVATSTARSSVDPLEIQDPNANNSFNVQCPVFCGAPSRFIFTSNAGGRLSGFTVNGGKFFGTPSTSAATMGGDGGCLNDVWFETGNLNTTGATNLTLNIHGGPFTYTGTGQFLEWSVNGVTQRPAGRSVAHTSGNHQLDMAKVNQTITFSGASIAFTGPANSIIGSVCHVRLTNASGGTVTPTASANYNLNGAVWPAIDNGETITFTVTRVPIAAGTAAIVSNITPPL
jgi:hypothetical protein